MDYENKYGRSTKAGKAERALAKLHVVERDRNARGAIEGYLLSASEESLARLYTIMVG